jgi:hypothetical protein
MTQGTYKGLSAPADELDIIEAYGGTGPTHPNQKGYWTTSHTWNQPDKQPGVYQQNPMTTIGGGSSWWETFHIYGFKITETDTIAITLRWPGIRPRGYARRILSSS